MVAGVQPGGRFKPWHQGLADHVRARVLGEAGVRQVEEVFCNWLSKGKRTGYGLRHRVRHLLAAERASEAYEVLTTLSELETRVEAGLAFESAADLAETASKL